MVFVATHKPVAQMPPRESSLGLPAQALLTSSMRNSPVIGWTISAQQLGMPPGTVLKLLDNSGDNGYLLGVSGTGWWLVGIDVTTGRRILAPVELGKSKNALAFACFGNGPAMVLCVRQDRDPKQPTHAWVVDTEQGSMLFDGPTVVRISSTQGEPLVKQVGDYAVATVSGAGAHGVGSHAQLTWFVPGNGVIGQPKDWERDESPQPVAVQGGLGSATADVVFSVADGKEVKPQVPQGIRLGRAYVYPGGFGYEFSATDDPFSDRVAFFDDSGALLASPDFTANLLTGSRDLPMVRTPSSDVVLNLHGREVLVLPRSTGMPYTRLIGEKLFISTDADQRIWQQYDLRSGQSGKTCDIESLGYSYIASDGEVAVLTGDDTPARAYELATCDQAWSLRGPEQSEFQDVWKVGTMLIGRRLDEVSSLVAPR